jgi:hypothetical protein
MIDLLGLHYPAITLVVLISLTVHREPGLLIALAVAVLMMYPTMVYAARPVTAFSQAEMRTPPGLTATLETFIGWGRHHVLVEAWWVYHAGRNLGWKMFRAGAPVGRAEYAQFLQSMDYALLDEPPMSNATKNILQEPASGIYAWAWTGCRTGSVRGGIVTALPSRKRKSWRCRRRLRTCFTKLLSTSASATAS